MHNAKKLWYENKFSQLQALHATQIQKFWGRFNNIEEFQIKIKSLH
jgi:hypothetical protein